MAKPVIDYSKCKTCGECIDVCPAAVFVKEGDKVVVKKPEDCIACRACEAQCPNEAIKVED
ncbi:MAG: 4Fe-4S dicluster domain-containing protein [bacterium]|nr:4Fe-4S dicluster domain-containing protein [bacterium]